MPLPDFQALMLPAAEFLAGREEASPREIGDHIADALGVPAEDLTLLLPSGKQTTFRNRIHWALHYLKRAGLIEAPRRGNYRITDQGRSLVASHPAGITKKTLRTFPAYQAYSPEHSELPATTEVSDTEAGTPEERLHSAYTELQESVAAEVLESLRVMDALRFERVVLEVLTAMGYGGADPNRASLTALSHDHGLDGIIKEDELGLDQVAVQAKRYNSTVGVQTVREFAGSLDEHGSNKGVLFTTDRFAGPAKDYVRSIPKRIVLVDGPELARLMVKHGVGVTVTETLDLTRIDRDYFDTGGDDD